MMLPAHLHASSVALPANQSLKGFRALEGRYGTCTLLEASILCFTEELTRRNKERCRAEAFVRMDVDILTKAINAQMTT